MDTSSTVPLDDVDAGHDKYINGALGRFIRTGLEDPPLGENSLGPTEPPSYRRDPERANIDGWCRRRNIHGPRHQKRRRTTMTRSVSMAATAVCRTGTRKVQHDHA